MSFNLGLEECNIASQGDYMDIELDNFIFEDMQDGAMSRLNSLVKSVNKLSSSEQIAILDFLANDPTVREIIGDDPNQYISNLKKYNDQVYESNEIIGVIGGYIYVAYANRLKGVVQRISRYRNARPTNTFEHSLTRDIRIVPPKMLMTTMQNNMRFLNHLMTGLNNLDKFNINSLYPYYEAIGLKIPAKHSGFLISGSMLELLGIIASMSFGASIAWSLALLGMGAGSIPLAILAVIAGTVVEGSSTVLYNKLGTKTRNSSYTTAGARGWNDNLLKQSIKEFDKLYTAFEKMDRLYNLQYKDMKKQYPDKFKAIKQAYKVIHASIKGCAKSTLVLCEAIYLENVQ